MRGKQTDNSKKGWIGDWIDANKWKDFTRTFIDPWVITLFLLTCIFILISIIQTNKAVIIFLSVMISLSSAVLGAILFKRWIDFTESKVLVLRGKTAIRNLKMLLNNITQLREKVIKYLCPIIEGKEQSKDTLKQFLEDSRDKCTSIQEEAVNSIENWTDITPEAEVKTQIGIISKLQVDRIEKELEITNIKKELNELRKKETVSEDENIKLTTQLKKMQVEHKNMEEKMEDLQKKIDITVPSTGIGYTSGVGHVTGVGYTSGGLLTMCEVCRNYYYTSSFSFLDPYICPTCLDKQK